MKRTFEKDLQGQYLLDARTLGDDDISFVAERLGEVLW